MSWHLKLCFKNDRLEIELYDLYCGEKRVAQSLNKKNGEMIVAALNAHA